MRIRRTLILVAAAALLAVVSEWIAHGPADKLSLRVADGVVGFMILCAAALVWSRRPANPIGVIMAVAGLAWFAGSLWIGLAQLHRGPLVHLHISYPTGRLRWWPAALTVAAVYVAAVSPLGRNDGVTVALSAMVAVAAVAQFLRTTGTARRASIPALFAALTFAGVLGVAAFARHADWQVDTELLWAYYVAIVVAVTVLLIDFLRARWSDAVVTNLVIDLGQQRGTGTLRAALGRALGDPDLVLAYRLDGDRYVDDAGRAVDVTQPGPGRVATEIAHDGAPLAVLIHDSAVLDDPALVDAVAAGAGLAVSNARMQAEARERLEALAASRRRLIEAGDTQRRQFGRELQETIQHRLADLASALGTLRGGAELPAELVDELARDLDQARAELDGVAQGLHPRALAKAGLAAAIDELAERLNARVDVTVATAHLPPSVEATMYYLCAEALTNVAKHAAATRVQVTLSHVNGGVAVAIADDGIGGADATRGSGLRNLADRVAALGGSLTVESPCSCGTRLHATIPL